MRCALIKQKLVLRMAWVLKASGSVKVYYRLISKKCFQIKPGYADPWLSSSSKQYT
jgi:hypothetical protein